MTKELCKVVIALLLVGGLVLHPVLVFAESRYAVLVGVGEYDPNTEVAGVVQSADLTRGINLKSPPNDLELISEVLSYYGFDNKNSTTLLNAQATRDGIIDAVKTRLFTLPAGSLAVFYFSGHGSALRGQDGQGKWNDETIVPYDGRIKGQPPRDIVDGEIYSWIEELNQKSVTSVLIFDSCFSGGIARVGGAEIKSLPALTEPMRSPGRDSVPLLRNAAVPGGQSAVVILTASDADEPAQGVLVKGRYQGVFTTALRNALLPANQSPPTKWSDVISAVVAALTPGPHEQPTQSPHLYGAKGAPVFDNSGPFSNSIDATRVSPAAATLLAGSDLGITEGSVFKVFGAGEVPWRASPKFEAMAKATNVTRQRATLQVLDPYVLKSDALAAVEFEYAIPDYKIKVHVPTPGSIDPFDREAIVSGLGTHVEITDVAPDLVVSSEDGRWELTTAGGTQIGSSTQPENSQVLGQEIGRRLAEYARWKRLSAWKRPDVGAPRLEYELSYRTADGVRSLQESELNAAQIPSGVPVQLLVENRGLLRIRVDALLLRPNYSIDVCPIGIIAPRQEFATEPVTFGSRTGTAFWKIIVSDPAENLSLLFLNSGARSAGNSLEYELAHIWNGVPSSSRAGSDTDSFWTTMEIPFSVAASSDNKDTDNAIERRCLGVPQN